MAWRNHGTHKAETKAVKTALQAVGINAKVGHGTGTAWAWLEINIGNGQQFGDHNHAMGVSPVHSTCHRCQQLNKIKSLTEEIARKVTGRHGDHGGEILILTQDHWNKSKNCCQPIDHPNWNIN